MTKIRVSVFTTDWMPWSDGEIKTLKNGYATSTPARELSTFLGGRSPAAIRKQASRLKIRFGGLSEERS